MDESIDQSNLREIIYLSFIKKIAFQVKKIKSYIISVSQR